MCLKHRDDMNEETIDKQRDSYTLKSIKSTWSDCPKQSDFEESIYFIEVTTEAHLKRK